MLRNYLLLTLSGIVSFNVASQSIDQRIGNAIKEADWFALDSIYSEAPKDSIDSFLETYSRCIIGNRLNRPDVSIPAFQELLNTPQLDLDVLIPSVHMFGMDLSRQGYNAEAATMIRAIVEQTEEYLDSTSLDAFYSSAIRYEALAQYTPYQIELTQNEKAFVPFSVVPVGPKEKDNVHIHLKNSSINGIEATITFDTGAGVNMMSPKMAKKYNLISLEGSKITVDGFGKSEGYFAIAKEIRLGNITVRDVPFVVASFSSHNDEADMYFESFNIVLGSELMLQLKDLTLDFSSNQIIVSKEIPMRTDVAPNMCFSSGMNLLTKGSILGSPTLMCLDSGDSGFGFANSEFFDSHKDYITTHGRLETIRWAGVGGAFERPCYKVPDIEVSMGGNTVEIKDLVVNTSPDVTMDYEARIGICTMMLFSKLRFNMVDFLFTTER